MSFSFSLFRSVLAGTILLAGGAAFAAPSSKVVVIKADDFRRVSKPWMDFLDVSRKAGVKVSIGVIVESVAGQSAVGAWMKAQQAKGDVEFWDHGWDHKQWVEGGKKNSEFRGSGLEHQREHLEKAQAGLKVLTGRSVRAFGTPFNSFDEDTAKVINATPELDLFFTHQMARVKPLVRPGVTLVDIISESDGTGKPNAEKFEADFEKLPAGSGPISLQFHPPYFDAAHLAEYEKIIVYLKAKGYAIKLPSEVVR